MDDWGIAAPAASAVSSATPILIGVLGIGAVGGIFGYLTKGKTGALVGAALGGLVGGVAGSYVGRPAAPSNVLPAGSYTLLGAGATLQPGETYLVSLENPTGAIENTAAVDNLRQAGFPVLGLWNPGQTPAGWPDGDPNTATGIHIALTNGDTVAHKLGSNATVWTTGNATT